VTTANAWKQLLNTNANVVCVITSDESDVDDLARSAPKGTAARVVRGTRCTTKERTFQEWAAALQFPSYFGNNWDALEECLIDLDWLNTRRTVVIVTQADALLPKSARDFTTLIDILLSAQQESPLLVAFHCAKGKEAGLRKRIAKALKSTTA
jgi:hypothetical protein